jgi:hypothetical protein
MDAGLETDTSTAETKARMHNQQNEGRTTLMSLLDTSKQRKSLNSS